MSGDPLLLQRPLNAPRLWFIAPAEPRDAETFNRLAALALKEVRAAALTDKALKGFVRRLSKSGKRAPMFAIDDRVAVMVTRCLASQTARQPVKRATVRYLSAADPANGRLCGTLEVRAWGHCLRTTYDLELEQ